MPVRVASGMGFLPTTYLHYFVLEPPSADDALTTVAKVTQPGFSYIPRRDAPYL